MIAGADDTQYMLRLPVALRDRLKARAEANGHSINTEVLAAIERHLAAGDKLAELERRVALLERKDECFGRYLAGR